MKKLSTNCFLIMFMPVNNNMKLRMVSGKSLNKSKIITTKWPIKNHCKYDIQEQIKKQISAKTKHSNSFENSLV